MKTWVGREKCLENEGRLRIENEVISFFKAMWVILNYLVLASGGQKVGNCYKTHSDTRALQVTTRSLKFVK